MADAVGLCVIVKTKDTTPAIIIIIIYSSIALISSSIRTCSVRCLEIACVQEHEN